MKHTILLLAFAALAFSSCTTAYKTGQTPDDVYFSPTQPQDEYVRTQKDNDNRYESADEYYDDRYLRMKVHNRTRWSNLDDWYYYGDRYSYNYYNSWNNPWNPHTYWNYYYSPYGSSIYLVYPKTNNIYNRPRTFNLSTYNGNLLTNGSYTVPRGSKGGSDYYRYSQPRNSYNSSSNNNNNGSFLRNIFSNNNSSRNSSNNNNSSNSSSNSSSSSSSGSSSSPAPVRKF